MSFVWLLPDNAIHPGLLLKGSRCVAWSVNNVQGLWTCVLHVHVHVAASLWKVTLGGYWIPLQMDSLAYNFCVLFGYIPTIRSCTFTCTLGVCWCASLWVRDWSALLCVCMFTNLRVLSPPTWQCSYQSVMGNSSTHKALMMYMYMYMCLMLIVSTL